MYLYIVWDIDARENSVVFSKPPLWDSRDPDGVAFSYIGAHLKSQKHRMGPRRRRCVAHSGSQPAHNWQQAVCCASD